KDHERSDIVVGNRTAVGTPCERSNNLPRATGFFSRRCGTAYKNLRAARRVAMSTNVVRPENLDAGEMRDGGVTELHSGLQICRGRVERLNQIVHVGVGSLDEVHLNGL